MRYRAKVFVAIFLVLVLSSQYLTTMISQVYAQPSWPSSWTQIDWDRNENGSGDDWRDVEYAYYQYDSSYLYLKLKCYDLPGKYWTNHNDGRYKWFIDLEGNMYYSGGNIYNAEYLLFAEDADHDGVGEIYLIFDTNNDNNFGEYEPWPPANYANYKITNIDIGGFRIVAPYQIEMYINWGAIGNPSSYWLMWSTDQQNPNLDQAPTTDRVDEGQPIAVHNVAAVNQTPTPTIVTQGEHVTIQVVVENKGTLAETFNVTCYFDNTAIGTQLATNLAAGHQTTLTFDWDTTGIPRGTYAIKAWADSSAKICETNEADNWCTSPATVTVESGLVHDVAAISQVPDKWSVVQGETVNINVTVKNLGDYSETFNVTCYYGNNLIGYQTVTNLPQNTQTSLIFIWSTIGVPPNTYYIRAMADSSQEIAEVNEDNNNCTSFQAVTVQAGPMGNLFVDKVKTDVISGEDPPVVGFSTVYELTIIVTNTGGSAVSNIQVNDTISSDVTFVSVGIPSQGSIITFPPPKIVWSVGTLNPGKNATLTFRVQVTPISLGLLYLNHKEDIIATGTDVPSGTPLSDTGDTDVTVTPIIRDVAAINQVPSSTVICQGDTVAVHVTVKNMGNVSLTFDVACYYDSNLIDVIRVYNLEANIQTTISFAWDTTGVAPGAYSITAEADSSYEISESDETNNICTAPSTVKIVLHDIAILSQIPSPTVVVQGETVTINVGVKNEGTEPETFTVSCYYNDTLLETKTVTDLQPGITQMIIFLWNTSEVSPATYFINTQASVVLGEKDTSDNACRSTNMVTINWLQYPITVTASPIAAIGGTFKVTYTKNGIPYTNVLKTTSWTEMIDADTTLTVSEPQSIISGSSGTRYKFDHYDPSSSVTMNQARTVTLVYKTQYLLTVQTNPSGLNPQPTRNPVGEAGPTNGWWYDAGTQVTLTAQTVTGYTFNNWIFDGSSLGNGVNPIIVVTNAPHTAVANYTVVIPQLTVTITPLSATIYVGESVTFASTVSGGTPPYSYQWYLNGLPVSGATSSTWIFTPTSSGIYYVYLEVHGSTVQSETARIFILEKPPVGGYTIQIIQYVPAPQILAYAMLVALFGIMLTIAKRKRK